MNEQDNHVSEEQDVAESTQDCSKETLEVVKQLFDEFNRAHLLEYIELVNSPKKLFWLNFFFRFGQRFGTDNRNGDCVDDSVQTDTTYYRVEHSLHYGMGFRLDRTGFRVVAYGEIINGKPSV